MLTIHKYTLEITDAQHILMSEGAKLLRVMVQHDKVCLWALVERDRKMLPRKFRIYGTGHIMVDGYPGDYVDTFMIAGGSLVFHVFDEGHVRS
jgi:hypothetical protein